MLRKQLKDLDSNIITKYTNYIEIIKPKTEEELLQRWLFAFCSIHTTWESTVRSYLAIKDLSWYGDHSDLEYKLFLARGGLHINKAKTIYEFTSKFYNDPQKYSFKSDYKKTRNELSTELKGIGLAKVSFAAEMIEPNSKVICLDVHTLRMVSKKTNINGKLTINQYIELEAKWLRACREFKFHPIASRHALWDKIQNKQDMRYWTWVFE